MLTDHTTKKPRKLTPFHHYLKLYYRTRVKAEYERRYASAVNEYEAASEAEREAKGLKRPVAVSMRAEVGKEFWVSESTEFREEVEKRCDEAHAKELEDWEQNQQLPKTPQQYHQQLAFAAQYIRPVADAIANQMQAAVSIFIIGPVPDRGGDVEVRRYALSLRYQQLS